MSASDSRDAHHWLGNKASLTDNVCLLSYLGIFAIIIWSDEFESVIRIAFACGYLQVLALYRVLFHDTMRRR